MFSFHATKQDLDYVFMQEKCLTFLSHIKKLMTQIVYSHPVATGRYFLILCCLSWLLIKRNKKSNQIASFFFTHKKTLQASRLSLANEVPSERKTQGRSRLYF